MNTDSEGRDVPENEQPNDIITVWEVTPHPGTRTYTSYIERSWQRMLDYVANHLDDVLERPDDDELEEGFILTFRKIRIAKQDYEELINDA